MTIPSARWLVLLAVMPVMLAGAGYGLATRQDQPAQPASRDARAAQPGRTRVDVDSLMADLRAFASPELQGRRSGSEGGRRARQMLLDAFAAIGLEPLGTRGHEQPFTFTYSANGNPSSQSLPAGSRINAGNVLGRVPGTVPGAKSLVVSAHFDHLGIREGVVYPGADDNASGVAALLAVARYVRAAPLRHSVIVAAFDAEELGLEGARTFVRQPPVPLESIALNVNLDMVSRSARHEIFAAGTHHTPGLRPILEEVQARSRVTLRFGHDTPAAGPADDWTLQSDHGAFHQAGVPFVYFGVENHPQYHQPSDTADSIDPAFFSAVVDMVIEAVLALDAKLP